MLIDKPNSLLYIHPWNRASRKPILDAYFLKVYYAIHYRKIGMGSVWGDEYDLRKGTKGVHDCTGKKCKCQSSNQELILERKYKRKRWPWAKKPPSFVYTNTLALHYLAYHRDEVPQSELNKIDQLLADPPPNFVPLTSEVFQEIRKPHRSIN